jgi:hypothetical protein
VRDRSPQGFAVYRAASVLLALCLMPVTAGAKARDDGSAKYKALVAQLKGGDTSIDFAALREAYAQSPDFDWEPDGDLRKQMYSALDRKDFSGAVKAAQKALDKDYLDIDAHHVLSLAYQGTGEPAKAKFHHDVMHGLIQAIFRSGDGKGQDNAFVVNSTAEEYIIMSILGLLLNKQSLVEGNGHQFDVMECADRKTHEKLTVYFNIDRPMQAMDKALKQR